MQADRSVLIVALGGRVMGISAATGEPLWRNDLKGGGTAEVALAIQDGAVYASAQGEGLFCLDYHTGELRWIGETSASGRATIVAERGAVFVAKSGYLDCFSPDGRKIWSQPLKGLGLGRTALGFPGNVQQADDPGGE